MRQPTVEDLLRHTSGFSSADRGNTALHRLTPLEGFHNALTPREFLDKLTALPLHYQPGTKWEYGLNFDLVGLVMERVTNRTLGMYLNERLFEPLDMVDTSFTIPSEKADRQAKPLPENPLTGVPQKVRDQTSGWKYDCGGGCLASTALDYLNFAQMLLNKGTLNGARILGRKSVEYMTTDHLGPDIDVTELDNFPSTHSYGHGWGLGVSVRRGTGLGGTLGSAGEFSWVGSQGTGFWVDPQEGMVIVFMAQTPGTIRRRNRQLIPALVHQAIVD